VTQLITSDHLLQELRALMPRRRLRFIEAQQIAEWQAALLRRQLDVTTPALPTPALLNLPFLKVTSQPKLPRSALLTQTELGWIAVVSSDEPNTRQRFSLAHELKHLIDDPAAATHEQAHIVASNAGLASERICDYFAACLLMPKVLIRRDWFSGLQAVGSLAKRYQVSPRAMERRLAQLGPDHGFLPGSDHKNSSV
jgi:predicted transcriptional regulator